MSHIIAIIYNTQYETSKDKTHLVLYTNMDQTLMNSLHRLLNCEISGLDSHVITTEYRTCVHCILMQHLFSNALVHVIYSVVSGLYSYTIQITAIVFGMFGIEILSSFSHIVHVVNKHVKPSLIENPITKKQQ